jgi:primase-polymerase (primpol)-like protein
MTAAGTKSKGRSKAQIESDPSRPTALAVNPAGIPPCLKERSQWVAWRYKWRVDKKGQGKWTKVPVNPKTGENAKLNEPPTWGTFERALAFHRRHRQTTDGLGYVFTADDPYVGTDLDDSLDPNGELYPWARPVVAVLATYTETSPSGTGVKLICEAAKPGDRCETKYNGQKVEMYEGGRFFALTGRRPPWYPAAAESRHEEVEYVYNRVLGEDQSPLTLKMRGGDDNDVIWMAAEATNGEKFLRLWSGDTSLHDGDDSAADLALCSLLAFWCGPDSQERIDRLFRRSRLMRDKWDERRGKQTYGQRTIAKALEDRTEFYGEGGAEGNGRAKGESEPGTAADAEAEEKSDKPPRKSQATELIELAASAVLFHDAEGEGYATVAVGDHRENHPLRSKGFRRWLKHAYYQEHRRSPGDQAVQDALGVLEARACYDGPELPVAVRLAEHGGNIYLDLGDAAWRAVEITAQDWRVIDNPPVRFRRPRGLLPLPEPVRGGSLDELRPFVNLPAAAAAATADAANAADAPWRVLSCWLTAAQRPGVPCPLLVLTGEQGTAKSTLAKLLRSLLDPSVAPLRSEPRDVRDLMIAATSGWLVALDNLSRLPQWLSDALCRLVTGGGFATRELYSDADEILFDAQRPALATSIEEVVSSGDLLDRSLLLRLEPIPEERRRTERDLWDTWEIARPRVLGALLDAVSGGLRLLPTVSLDKMPRMADFARWAEAVGRGLGWKPGAALAAYRGVIGDAVQLDLEASPVATVLLEMLDKGPKWSGTAAELLERLTALAGDRVKIKGWPSRPHLLSGRLRRLAPSLRRVDVWVEFQREGKVRARVIRLERRGETASAASAASASASQRAATGDREPGCDDDADE